MRDRFWRSLEIPAPKGFLGPWAKGFFAGRRGSGGDEGRDSVGQPMVSDKNRINFKRKKKEENKKKEKRRKQEEEEKRRK